jgi:ABC-type multidrug transport system ATPase subunit
VDDVKELCNEIAILNGGKILTQGTPTAVIETLNGSIWTKIIDREALEENEKTSMLFPLITIKIIL